MLAAARRDLSFNNISWVWNGAFVGLSTVSTLDLTGNPSSLCIAAGALAPLFWLTTFGVPSPWPCTATCPATAFEAPGLKLSVCQWTPPPQPCAYIPAGCSCSGSTLISCAGFTGGATLELGGNGITSIASAAFAGMPYISTLAMAFNALSTLSSGSFVGLPSLTSLDLSHNAIYSVAHGAFGGLLSVAFLDMEDNRLTSIRAGMLSGLPALTTLLLGWNQILALPSASFSAVPLLTHLDASFNNVTSIAAAAFFGLSSVETLDLYGNPATLCITAGALAPLIKLTTFGVPSPWPCTASCPATAFQGQPVCETPPAPPVPCAYVPAGCHCSGSTLTSCAGYTGGATLELGGNGITAIESGAFAGLADVTTLALGFNALSTLSSGSFVGLASLNSLDLSFNAISSIAHGAYGGLGAVTFLDVSDNRLMSISSGMLSGLPALTTLLLSGNNITSVSSDAFLGLSGVTTLDLSANPGALCLAAGALSPLRALTAFTVPSPWPCSAACPATSIDGQAVCESSSGPSGPTPSPGPPTPPPAADSGGAASPRTLGIWLGSFGGGLVCVVGAAVACKMRRMKKTTRTAAAGGAGARAQQAAPGRTRAISVEMISPLSVVDVSPSAVPARPPSATMATAAPVRSVYCGRCGAAASDPTEDFCRACGKHFVK